MKNIIDVHGNKTRAIYHITIRGTGAWAQIDVRSTGPKAIPEYTIAVDEPDQLVSCMTNAINAAEFLVQKEREKGTLCANISPNNTFIAIDNTYLRGIDVNTIVEILETDFIHAWIEKTNNRLSANIKVNVEMPILELLGCTTIDYRFMSNKFTSIPKRRVNFPEGFMLRENSIGDCKYSLENLTRTSMDGCYIADLQIPDWMMPLVDAFMDENADWVNNHP